MLPLRVWKMCRAQLLVSFSPHRFNIDAICMLKPQRFCSNQVESNEPENAALNPKKLEKLKAKEEKKRLHEARINYMSQIQTLHQNRQVHEAADIFLKMLNELKCSAPEELYNDLINDCLSTNATDQAYEIYRQMYDNKIPISLKIIEQLVLQIDTMNSRSKRVKHLRKTLAVNGYKPTEKIYNTLIRYYIGDNNWKVGLSLADSVIANGLAFEEDTFNYLLAGYGEIENDGFYRCLEIWYDMKRKSIIPNTYGLNGFLSSIEKCKQFDMTKMLETLQRITVTLPPEIATTMVDGQPILNDGRPHLLTDPRIIGHLFPLSSVLTPQHVLLVLGGLTGILREIQTKNIVPNEETILKLLALAPNSLEADDRIYHLMERHRLDIQAESYYEILLQRRCIRQEFDATLDVVNLMRSNAMKIDLAVYGMLSLSCRSVKDTEYFFREIDEFNIVLKIDIINAMLKNAVRLKNESFIIEVLRGSKQRNIEPDQETINLIMAYHEETAKLLKVLHSLSRQERNDCFKFLREIKQYLKHFNIRKDDIELAGENENWDNENKG